MLNLWTGIGRLTRDPELTYTTSGIAMAKFDIAVDRDFKNKETGEKETDFIRCVAWRNQAEFLGKYIQKGRQIAVTGRIQCRSWTNEDGKKNYATEINVENINALGSKPQGEEGSEAPAPRAAATPASNGTGKQPVAAGAVEDDPWED